MWGSNPSPIREKLGILSSLLMVGCHTVYMVYHEIVSQLLLPASMWVFLLTHSGNVAQLFCGFSPKEM